MPRKSIFQERSPRTRGTANANVLRRGTDIISGAQEEQLWMCLRETLYFILVPEEDTECPHIHTVGAQ